jgi:hypothetical protein
MSAQELKSPKDCSSDRKLRKKETSVARTYSESTDHGSVATNKTKPITIVAVSKLQQRNQLEHHIKVHNKS